MIAPENASLNSAVWLNRPTRTLRNMPTSQLNRMVSPHVVLAAPAGSRMSVWVRV